MSATLHAQADFAKLEINRNIQAAGLIHKLNSTKDTLILKSAEKINYLYSINKENRERDLDISIDSTFYKFPLNKLKKGKHVLVAVQSPKRIVFVVRILKESFNQPPKKLISREPTLNKSSKVVSAHNTNHRSNNSPLKQ